MIFVLLYVIVSAIFFVWVMSGARFKRLPSKTTNRHPEMKEVRQTDPLLVVRFDERSDSDNAERSADLGFARFLADHDPYNGNSSDS
mgnify:CR=1 FL=1